jgi:XTP/dITP diphosphohydrolase
MSEHEALARLIGTMATLRGPGGCPWDAEQSHESLVPYLLEEVFELVEALETGNPEDIREELGDVLYQLLFHADIATSSTTSPFGIEDVAASVDEKMRQRHPHVFAGDETGSIADVVGRWEEIKKEQKKHRESVLDGIPQKLSALARAASVLKRSTEVLPPLPAGLPEFQGDQELGELLLALVSAARATGLDAEGALRRATRELENRVQQAEQSARNGVQEQAES